MSKYSSDPKYVFMQSMEEADKNMSDVLYAHILEEITKCTDWSKQGWVVEFK